MNEKNIVVRWKATCNIDETKYYIVCVVTVPM